MCFNKKTENFSLKGNKSYYFEFCDIAQSCLQKYNTVELGNKELNAKCSLSL